MTNPRPSPWLLALLALLSGGLLVLCFPPFGLYPLAWVALVPLLAALARAARPRQGAWLGLLTGLALFGALHRYLLMYGLLPTLGVAVLEALPLALFGFVAVHLAAGRRALRQAAALAGAWVLAEWLRAHLGGLSLTLGQLGYSQQPSLPLLQSASLAGALGISFLIVLLNAALAAALFPRDRRLHGRWAALALAAALVGLTWAWGNRVLRRPLPSGPPLTVAVVQPNVPLHTPVTAEDEDKCLKEYPRYTDLLMALYGPAEEHRPGRPQLVVWPETAFAVALNQDAFSEEVARLTARQRHVWLLMGALEVQTRPEQTAGSRTQVRTYNNAWLFDPEGTLRGTYTKNDLVPFGEYVPFRDRLPFIQRYPVRDFDFTPGAGRNLLEVEGRRCGALICFEAIFPDPSRQLVARGAEFLAFLTSDAWAGPSHEVLLHSQTAPLRAVETGRWVVRAAATGESGIISPRGEWVDSVPPWHSGVAQAQIAALQGRTPYDRWGDWPLLGLALGLVLLGWRRGRQFRSGPARPGPR
jgi:apolipoprotein N-acyltransferase